MKKPKKKNIPQKTNKKKVSEAETIHSESKKKEIVVHIDPNNTVPPPTKEELQEQLLFQTIEETSQWIKLLKKFEHMVEMRIKFWVYLAYLDKGKVTQRDFCKHYKKNESEVSKWKHLEDVDAVRKYCLKSFLQDRTPKILKKLADAVEEDDIDGKVQLNAIKLFLAYTEDFSEKMDLEVNHKWSISVGFANLPSSQFHTVPDAWMKSKSKRIKNKKPR